MTILCEPDEKHPKEVALMRCIPGYLAALQKSSTTTHDHATKKSRGWQANPGYMCHKYNY
jgi:hypothetical protein